MTTQEQSLVDSSTNLPESQTLVQRLRIRAAIRRSIPSRKSVQEGKPDRIDSRGQSLDDDADLLEESADEIERLTKIGNQEWVSVKDALPEKYRACLVYPWTSDYVLTAELQSDGWCYAEYITGYGAEVHTLPKGRITHWKYLEAPK